MFPMGFDKDMKCQYCGQPNIGNHEKCTFEFRKTLVHVAVVARSLEQFWYHIKELVPEPKRIERSGARVYDQEGRMWFWVGRPDHLRGRRRFRIERVGQWDQIEQNALVEIMQIARMDALERGEDV